MELDSVTAMGLKIKDARPAAWLGAEHGPRTESELHRVRHRRAGRQQGTCRRRHIQVSLSPMVIWPSPFLSL